MLHEEVLHLVCATEVKRVKVSEESSYVRSYPGEVVSFCTFDRIITTVSSNLFGSPS